MMSSSDPFKLLGLDRKLATEADVRKAYAKQLKIVRPDEDPQGFMALRQAYDQARNQLKWAAEEIEEDDIDDDAQEEGEAYQDWYDKELGLWLDNTPAGQLIEQCARWIIVDKGKDAATFFQTLSQHQAFVDTNAVMRLMNWLLWKLGHDVGLYKKNKPQTPDNWTKQPEWLSDETILALYDHFDWQSIQPDYASEASKFNCFYHFVEPVLLDAKKIDAPFPRYDAKALHIQEMEKSRKDDHGSYYDREAEEWVDMSPVGRAMRDIKALTNQPWGKNEVAPWQMILEREELQPIEEFQRLERELRQFFCKQTGQGKQPNPTHQPWVTKDIILYLDSVFGWSTHSGGQYWEKNQYQWLQKIIGRFKDLSSPEATLFNQPMQSLSDYDRLGYQPLPWFLRAIYLLLFYLVFRLVVI